MKKILQKNKEFIPFVFIGFLSALVHVSVVVLLVELFALFPVTANVIAFILANILSFILNCKFSFKKTASIYLYKKFFSASLVTFISIFLLSILAEMLTWGYLMGVLLAVIISPIFSFLLQKYWTFKI